MFPGTDRAAGAVDLHYEGEGYARALLDRIGAGTASPDDLAMLMQFLHSGPVLHGACALLFLTLRLALGHRLSEAAALVAQPPTPGRRCDAR